MSDSTPDELKAAAARRLPYGKSLGASVVTPRGYSMASQARDRTIPTIRVTNTMAESIASFANATHMNTSDAVRSLIDMGLQTWRSDNE